MKVRTEPRASSEIVKDWTVSELKQELLIWKGVEIGRTQFYEWLKFSGIKPKRIYTERDRRKLLKFAEMMSRYNNLSVVSIKLIEYVNTHPGEFPQDG